MTDSTTVLGTSDAQANILVNANTAGTDKVGVFTSTQSLVTFPGATFAVTLIWSVLRKVGGPEAWCDSEIVPLILSVLIGAIIYLTSVQQGGAWRDHLMGGSVALVNSFMIASAVIGVGNIQNTSNPVLKTDIVASTPTPTPPPTADEVRLQAENAFDSDDFQIAVQKYTELIELAPQESWHYKDRGNSYRKSGGNENLVLAIADYTKALELIEFTSPDDSIQQKRELYLDRGNSYSDLKETGKARADFAKVCEVDKNSEECTAAKNLIKKR